MKIIYILHILLCSFSISFAQKPHYKELMNNPNVSYFDIKQAFNNDEKVREKTVKKAERQARWGIISKQKAEAIEEQAEEEEVHFYRYEKFIKKGMDKDGFYDHTNTIKEYDKFVASPKKTNLRIAVTPKWNNIGPLDLVSNNDNIQRHRGIGRIGVIEFHPTNPNIIYAGSAGYSGVFLPATTLAGGGGLWKSIDAGKTWLPMIDNQKNLNIMDISIDPSNPETVYAIWADGTGIWKSADGGQNWTNIEIPNNPTPFLGQSQTKMFSEVIVDPKNSQHLIVSSGNGVFVTMDGGINWSKSVPAVIPDTNFYGIFDLEIKPNDGNIVYATNHQAFLYKSVDGGKTFTKNTTLTQFAAGSSWRYTKIAVSASAPSTVFIAGGNEFDNRFMGIVRSDNEGSTFSVIKAYGTSLGTGSNEGLTSFSRNFAFSVSPTDVNLMTVGGVYLNGSTDGGKTFKFIGSNIHADIAEVKYQPSTGRHLVGCDGGLFEIQQNGNVYAALNLNKGMATTQIDHIDVSPHKPSTYVIGTQDNGTMKYEDGKWELISGGDGSQSRFDPKDPKLIWTNFIFGPMVLYKFVGLSPTVVYPPIRENYQTNNIFNGILYEFDKNSNYMYVAATNKLSRTNNGGQSWEVLSTLTNDNPKYATSTHYNERFVDFAIAPSNPLVVYAIVEQGTTPSIDASFYTKIMRSDDGGKTWNTGTKASFYNLTVHPTNPKTLWVTFLNFVWKSVDGGEKWTDVSGSIPKIPKFAMKYHEGSDDGIYVGTAIGVYYKDNTMTDWVLWGEGLPGTLVTDIEIDYLRNKVVAGTYGRGLWEADLAVKIGSVSNIESISNKCLGDKLAVNFSISGKPSTPQKYTVQLSDANGDFKTPITLGEGSASPINITLANNLASGKSYKIRVLVNSEVNDVLTGIFSINSKSTAAFETKEATIQQYKSLDVKLSLSGDVPINVKLSDNQAFDFNELSPTIKLSPNTATEYKISSVSNTCGNGTAATETLKITVTPVLANEPNTNESFQIFPNPSAELITVKLNNFKKAKQTLQLIDNKGIIIFQKNIENDEETISLRDISTGTYIIRVMNGEKVLSKRVVKVE